jgi:tRNA(fMet)-specific endonuclease VapC
MYLLDTTHCLYIMARFPRIEERLRTLGKTKLSTCVIVEGELLVGAYKSNSISDNIQEIEDFLKDMIVYVIDSDTAEFYGILKNIILDNFGPKDRSKRRNFKVESLGFMDNDLWITIYG